MNIKIKDPNGHVVRISDRFESILVFKIGIIINAIVNHFYKEEFGQPIELYGKREKIFFAKFFSAFITLK